MRKKNNKHSPVSGKLKVAQQQIEVLKKELSESQMWQGAYKNLKVDVDRFIKAVGGGACTYGMGMITSISEQKTLSELAVQWGELKQKAELGDKLLELEILPVNENEKLKLQLENLNSKLTQVKDALS